MRGHLTDSEMTAYMAGRLEGEARAHLAACEACRHEAVRLRASLVGLAVHLHTNAERSDAFFRAQRTRTASRLGESRAQGGVWWRAWAPTLAAAALLAVLLTRGGAPPRTAQESETDQTFLRAVQHSIHAEVPIALRPAAMLIAEMERTVSQPDRGLAVRKGDQP